MEAIAFALDAELEGTTEIERDGETVEVPKFGGALLAVDGVDFDVAEHLQAGDGLIVVRQNDSTLAELLAELPALREVDAPAGATPISPYERRTVDQLREIASLRDIAGAGNAGHGALVTALDRYDELVADGDNVAAANVRPGDEPDGLDKLRKPDLLALAANHDEVDVSDSDTVPTILAALRAAGVRKED